MAETILADGTVPEGRGITPDLVVDLDPDALGEGRDTQLEAAIAYVERATR
ncbi:MAG: hypothetical protein ACE5FJ_01275 [Gemmatimonadales bacterium]